MSSSSPTPAPLMALTGLRLAEAELVELGGFVAAALVVCLVGDEQCGLAGAPQHLRDLVVG